MREPISRAVTACSTKASTSLRMPLAPTGGAPPKAPCTNSDGFIEKNYDAMMAPAASQ
jgi:hypothetical protein